MNRSLLAVAPFLLLCACGGSPEAPNGAPALVPSASLAQVMRGLLYPNSEIIFAAQSEDPEAVAARDGGQFGNENLYRGWEGVENAALMLSEAATLILVPQRYCENGLPVPLQNDDFRMFARNLIDAGRTTYEAARTRDMDAMVEASGVVSDACQFCHERYRDRSEDEDRCHAD